jgi:hypothetical protein
MLTVRRSTHRVARADRAGCCVASVWATPRLEPHRSLGAQERTRRGDRLIGPSTRSRHALAGLAVPGPHRQGGHRRSSEASQLSEDQAVAALLG